MGGFSVARHGEESVIKTPTEAPIPSAINSPLANTVTVVFVSGIIPLPQFGALMLPRFHPEDQTIYADVPPALYTPQWYYERNRIFRGRTVRFERIPQWGNANYLLPDPRILVDDADAVTYFPSTSRDYQNNTNPPPPELDYLWKFIASNGQPEVNPVEWKSPNTAHHMYPTHELERYFVTSNQADDIKWHWLMYDDTSTEGQRETRSDEYTPTQCAADLKRVLDYLDAQNFAAVWAGQPVAPYGAFICRWPGPFRIWNPETQLYESYGHSMEIGGAAAAIAPSALQAFMDARGVDSYDGQIYPLSSQQRIHASKATYPLTLSNLVTARTRRNETFRVQLQVSRKTPYTLFEMAQVHYASTIFPPFGQHHGWRYRPIGRGILLPGETLELPRPSFLEFPKIVLNGSFCVLDMTVGFLPDIELEEYVQRRHPGVDAAVVQSW